MKTARVTLSALLLGATAVLVSCGEHSPLGPTSQGLTRHADVVPLTQVGDNSGQNADLLVCSPLPYASVTQTIGPSGGVIQVGAHTLSIPKGALKDPVTITAVSPTGNVNHIVFQPEGLEFGKPASLTMSYANCDLLGSAAQRRIAYTDATLKKIKDKLLSVDDASARKVTGQLNHFSDYAVAW